VLAGAGALAAAVVLAAADDAGDGPLSTVIQLAIVAALMATLGTWSVRRSMERAIPLDPKRLGSGEPTALWKLPLIVAALALAFGFGAGWDAALRIGGGCLIVGCAQAVLFERLVAREESRSARRFYRVPGSSVFTGTKLGALPSHQA
jgi:hypothetical protein